LRDGFAAKPEPVTEIVVKRKPELLARLHQTEHGIAGNTTASAHGAAGDLSLGHKRPQGILRCVGVQRNVGVIEDFQQLGFPSMQPLEKLVECLIAGA
jgi:hypothetical protein